MKASRSFYESDVLCVFVFWQREKPIETGNVGSVYTIYVVARVDRRFDSSRPSCRKARLVAMAVVKAILSYRSGEEKPVERYKTRVKVTEEHKLLSSFRKNVIEFLGINEQAQKFGLGSYELKLWRLVKSNGKTAENLGITTQQQLDLELPFLLGSEGESELNGKKSVI